MKNRRFIIVTAGTLIKHAAQDAIKLAKKENVDVFFKFNGVDIKVTADSDVNSIDNQYSNKVLKAIL